MTSMFKDEKEGGVAPEAGHSPDVVLRLIGWRRVSETERDEKNEQKRKQFEKQTKHGTSSKTKQNRR